jgi:acyl dehydratase
VSDTRPVWNVGDKLESRTLPPITRSRLVQYAEASGDHNPIHTTDEAAEEAGLHGMLTAATMGLPFSPYLKHGYVKELQARFSGMVRLGDELTVVGRVSGKEDTEEGSVYTFEVYASNGDSTVASGTVDFLVYDV